MTASVELGNRSFTFAHGVHPLGKKALAENAAIEVLPTPAEVRIPLLQHLGAPCVLSVKPRDQVAIGDLLGDSEEFISAPVHSSIAGKVARLSVATLPNGRHVDVVPIKAAKEQPIEGESLYAETLGGPWPTDGLDRYEPRQIADAARQAGLVGLGGAAFPTHVKLRPNASDVAPQTDRASSQNLTQRQQVSAVKKSKPIDTLLVNGCECEPYLTADARVMIESPQAVVAGALLAGRAVGAQRVLIGIEDNKPRAIEAICAASAGTPAVTQVLKTKYPQGSEKQLIDALLRRKVPVGGLPLDVGVVVINVGTSAALARAVLRGKPLTHRVVTVSGEGIRTPKNLLVPVGVAYRQLIEYCGGLTSDVDRVIAGGPMMGFTLGDLDTPVTKGTSGITVLSHAEVRRSAETACIRCGRCVDVCPMQLVPTRIALGARTGQAAVVARYHATACVECGCCAFECPASIPLVQLIRVGKLMLRPPATKA